MQNKYSSSDIEQKHYRNWENQGYFQPSMDAAQPAFSIQLPPPNVTGTLHMGHAFNQTIMDALTRYHRMKGDNTCWIPGSDHAGIATQIVVERQLAAENISRHDLGRETFIDKVWEWKAQSGGIMAAQMRRVGCSVDWSREYFTMDATRADVVTEVFVRLYEQGLIYRGKRLVNWDPVLGTAVSDLEVESVEEQGFMYYVRYPFAAGQGVDGEFMRIATTRPETILADGAIAVYPGDERYRHLVGKKVHVPMTERIIPVIEDEYVDKDFGSGCVKITPAHDFNDYAVGQRHEMEIINLFHDDASMNGNAPEAYRGLDRFAAREKIVADLQAAGLLEKIEPHTLMRPRGDRTGTVIEPYLTDQWFVAMSATPKGGEPESGFAGMSLAQKAKHAVDSGQVRFIPENWVNTYNQWMNNIQDWCISRQLWWGHQIPAWYDEAGNVYVARNEAEAQKLSGSLKLTRDEDVLDTWFSSALVPFSTLGWPENTAELKAFLPSNVLVTGYEIIFFWVARMIMMTTHFTGKVPFRDVYIHGMVRDHEGRKMSKSEGNVIDPVDLIDGVDLATLLKKRTTGLRRPEKAPQVIAETQKIFPDGIPAYGADALRFTMASYASLGRNINFDFKRCEGYRNFCNKLFNAARFVLMNTEGKNCAPLLENATFADRWILTRLHQTIAAVTEALDTYRLDLAAQHLFEFVWNEYCDWYLEIAKVQMSADFAPDGGQHTRHTLLDVLETVLRLLHPIMPFITEELWQEIAPAAGKKNSGSIMLAAFPVADSSQNDSGSLKLFAGLQETVNAVRNLRAAMNLSPALKPPLLILNGNPQIFPYLPALARLKNIETVDRLPEGDAPVAVCRGAELMLQVEIDKEAEAARLNKEKEKVQKMLDKLSAKLARPGYTEKAPRHLVEKDQADLAELESKIGKIQTQLDKLQ